MASTTSTNRRKWITISKRWQKELEELANMEESKVTKVGGLTFVPDEERFQISLTGQTEVLLGLRDDGTEVAIRKIFKYNFNKLEQELEILLKLRFKSRHVAKYVDTTYDGHCGYIAMQLCEFNLEEYITQRQPANAERKRIAREFLEDLKDLHENDVIHRDIKPHNISIDIKGQVRLADFGTSLILDPGQTTKVTDRAGTKCWEATEIIRGQPEDQKPRYKRSTDIQVAGMLVYYILSGGRHPFGEGVRCQANILDGNYTLEHLTDEEAKDLVKRMINITPEERPRITEVLEHPYFWEEDRKEMFLKAVGNVREVEKHLDSSNDENLARIIRGKSFSTWKTQLNHVTDDLDDMKTKWLDLVKTRAKDDGRFPETLFCLLRFIRNCLVHSGDEIKEINVMKLFPDLVVTAYKCAEERDWEVKGEYGSIFRKERPAAAASASSSHSSDAAELHLRDKAQQDPGAQFLSDTPKEGLHSNDPQRTCESCAEVPDTNHWVLVKAEVSTEKSVSTYSLSSSAGSYECSESGLRWSCAGPVTLQYHFTDWYVFAEELAHMQSRPAGPLMDISLMSGELEEIHLPHFLCLGGCEASARDAVRVLHGQDSGGVCVEVCELTRHHARVLHPCFSLYGTIFNYLMDRFSPKVHCELLLFCTCPAPLTLHVYPVPNDPALISAIHQEEKQEGVKIRKGGTLGSLQREAIVEVSTSCQSAILPEKMELWPLSTSKFFEVYIDQEVESFDMNVISSQHTDPIWRATIRRRDYSRSPGRVRQMMPVAPQARLPGGLSPATSPTVEPSYIS